MLNLKKIINNKNFWIFICGFLLVVIVLLILIILSVKNKDNNYNKEAAIVAEEKLKEEKKVEPNTEKLRRNIDGVLVEKGKENVYPVAAIIDNLIESRPQSGLSKANLVIEAETEAGITRYLAFFADDENLDKIGPVRSARPYFADWTSEYGALLAHVGGSPEALTKMDKENILHINEFSNGGYFWRDKNLSAPHNVFTSRANLDKFLEKNNILEANFESYIYKDDAVPEERTQENEINIYFPRSGYDVHWKYNPQENAYIRFLNGIEHVDKNGDQIKTKNVIIQYIPATVLDSELRLKINTIGSGKAIFCQDGKCEEGSWKKPGKRSRTKFYNKNGEEFSFNAGPTWIEAVRPEYKITY